MLFSCTDYFFSEKRKGKRKGKGEKRKKKEKEKEIEMGKEKGKENIIQVTVILETKNNK